MGGSQCFFSKGSETFEAAKLSFTESKWNILGASESGLYPVSDIPPKMEALPGNMMIHQRNLRCSPSFSYTPVIGSHIHELAYNLIYISIEYQTSNSYSVINLSTHCFSTLPNFTIDRPGKLLALNMPSSTEPASNAPQKPRWLWVWSLFARGFSWIVCPWKHFLIILFGERYVSELDRCHQNELLAQNALGQPKRTFKL